MLLRLTYVSRPQGIEEDDDTTTALDFLPEPYGRQAVIAYACKEIYKEIEDGVVSSVSVDNRQGAYEGMKHLLSLGYRDILFVRGAVGAEDARLRLEGCERALKEAAQLLNTAPGEVPVRVAQLMEERRKLERHARRARHRSTPVAYLRRRRFQQRRVR